MKFTVYILFSESAQKYYIGQTKDFENRIMEHNLGETSSIKYGIPWKLVWSTIVETRTESMSLERKIKNKGARRFISSVQ